jgi:predicted TPR repeat methyltransferase
MVNIKKFFINIFSILIGFIKSLRQVVPQSLKTLRVIKFKLANLEKVNFELVDMHIRNGNISDAILRLKIISNFIVPGSTKAYYKLAWCYFVKSDFTQSLATLSKCREIDSYQLEKFLSQEKTEHVPLDIWTEYKNFSSFVYHAVFTNKKINLHEYAVDLLLQNLRTLPVNCQILDLGAFVGMNAEMLDSKTPKKYTITGVEDSKVMYKILQGLGLYEKIYNSSVDDFLSNCAEKYHAIISVCSLGFINTQAAHFASIGNILHDDGYFILVLKGDVEAVKLNSNRVEFLYNKNNLEKELSGSGFIVVKSENVIFDSSSNYIVLVCKINI